MTRRTVRQILLLSTEVITKVIKVFAVVVILGFLLSIFIQFHWFPNSAWWSAIGTTTVAIIALWPKLRIFFFGTKVEITIAEKIALVVSSDTKINKIQIGINLINESIKDLLVNRMILTLKKATEPKIKYVLDWNLFIEDFHGSGTAPKERPHPFVVKAEDSHFEMVQFYSESGQLNLVPGEYKLYVDVWVNQKNISEPPKFVESYSFEITEENIGAISIERNEVGKNNEPLTRLVHIPISDWMFTKRF